MRALRLFLSSALCLGMMAITMPAAAQTDGAGNNLEPFGWATCSTPDGTAYAMNGGEGNDNPRRTVLYATGNDRQKVVNAISNFDIIILDGSQGDFIFDKSASISNAQNKTIVGRNNARLCTQWVLTPEIKAALEAANLDQYSTQAGSGGTLSNGKTVGEACELHTRQLLIDLTGDSQENYRNAGIFIMNSSDENIIIRNLTFVGPGSVDIGGADLISNNGGTHVWIDHCEFIDGMDGNLDSGYREGNPQFVTYSWNVFRYTERSFSHPLSNGIFWRNNNLQYVTFAYNIWGNGCKGRMPWGRGMRLHALNNYYNCPDNNFCIGLAEGSQALAEGNYAENGVKNPFRPGNGSDNLYVLRQNVNFGTYSNKKNTDQSLEVPYPYTFFSPEQVPEILQATQGAGATLDNVLTGIKEASNDKKEEKSACYNAAGQLIGQHTPGIIIKSGKSFYNKQI